MGSLVFTNMDTKELTQLIKRIQSQDQQAEAIFYKQYRERLTIFCELLCHAWSLQNGMVIDIFADFVIQVERLNKIHHFEGLLFRIAYTHCTAYRRRHRKHRIHDKYSKLKSTELVILSNDGDGYAFSYLKEKALRYVEKNCRSMLNSNADKDFLLREFVDQTLEKLGKLKNPGVFWSWFRTAIKRKCINYEDSTQGKNDKNTISAHERINPERVEEIIDRLHDSKQNSIKDIDRKKINSIIKDSYNLLSEDDRLIAVLFYQKYYKVREIARVLNDQLSENAIRIRLYYIRKILRKYKPLKKLFEELYGD